MTFRKQASKRRRISATLDMTPMIDCVFQLLIFFMLTSSFVAQSSINVQLPKAQGATVVEQKSVSITLEAGTGGPDGQGRIHVDSDEMISMSDLEKRLAEVHARNPDLAVLIRPDRDVPTGRLVEVLGITGSLGITKYRIQAKPAEKAG